MKLKALVLEVGVHIFLQLIYFTCSQENDTNGNSSGSWETYGTDWVLFPDETGTIHFVNMTPTNNSDIYVLYKKVHFQLYTRSNPNEYEEIFIDDNEESNENEDKNNEKCDQDKKISKYFIGSNSLKMLSHGWLSSGNSETIINMKNAYINTSDVNVVAIDWSEIADEPSYVKAAESTRYVGKQVGKMASTLMRCYSMNGSMVHLVGHSLGAHVVGYAGRWLNEQKIPIARVTGLDPARPLFEVPPVDGIRPTDADFVDIIHTNGGILGVKYPHGVADFFPNGGGPVQSGCGNVTDIVRACSHARSHEYFTESILTAGFVSRQCDSWSSYKAGDCKNNESMNMGEPCLYTARGNYYLYTNEESPYSKDES